MSKHLIIVLAAGAALSGAFAVSAARAADPGVCEDYARAAVSQFHQAQDHRRCHEFIRNNPTRWEDVRHERDARTDALRECAHD